MLLRPWHVYVNKRSPSGKTRFSVDVDGDVDVDENVTRLH